MKIFYALLLGVLCSGVGQAGPRHATDEADAIRQARRLQNAAIVQHDLGALASYWTEDVTICRGLGAQVVGKANYLKLFADDVPGAKDLIVYERMPAKIDVSRPWPLAFESGVWTGRLGSPQGPVVIQGRYSAQWVKRDDRWLIRSEVFVALDGAGSGLDLKAAP